LTGKGSTYREIDVLERVRALGVEKCQALIGFHNFTGADWGGKMVGISKKTWMKAFLQLDEQDPIITAFQNLGQNVLPKSLTNDKLLPLTVRPLEQFVCLVYCSSGPKSLPALRWHLFRTKNQEGEMLPPTRSALLPHILRANFVAMRDKSYSSTVPKLPPVDQHGWEIDDKELVPVRCLSPPAPHAIIELVKCACKSGCMTRCSCRKNSLPCTPLCKCSENCDNLERIVVEDSEEDSDNDD
jgi:hypothetical protein